MAFVNFSREILGLKTKLTTYSTAQAAEILQRRLPAWVCVDGCIQRGYDTAGWKATLMVVNTIGHLAEVAWHHPELSVSYNRVIVSLVTHSEKAITDLDFELAEKIDQVVLWQPANEAGSLSGTPDSDRHRYLVYKDQ